MLTALMDNAGRSSTSSRRARLVGKGTASMEEVNANMAMVENEVYILYIYVYIFDLFVESEKWIGDFYINEIEKDLGLNFFFGVKCLYPRWIRVPVRVREMGVSYSIICPKSDPKPSPEGSAQPSHSTAS